MEVPETGDTDVWECAYTAMTRTHAVLIIAIAKEPKDCHEGAIGLLDKNFLIPWDNESEEFYKLQVFIQTAKDLISNLERQLSDEARKSLDEAVSEARQSFGSLQGMGQAMDRLIRLIHETEEIYKDGHKVRD